MQRVIRRGGSVRYYVPPFRGSAYRRCVVVSPLVPIFKREESLCDYIPGWVVFFCFVLILLLLSFLAPAKGNIKGVVGLALVRFVFLKIGNYHVCIAIMTVWIAKEGKLRLQPNIRPPVRADANGAPTFVASRSVSSLLTNACENGCVRVYGVSNDIFTAER